MTLALYEDALPALQDHLPDWWATKYDPTLGHPVPVLYALLLAFATAVDQVSADLENLHADMALSNATLNGLVREYAYAYGIDNEQLPPTSTALRQYLQAWAGVDGSTVSIVRLLTTFLSTAINVSGTQLVFDAGGAGITLPSDGSPLILYQQTTQQSALNFPVDGSGFSFPSDGSGLLVPVVSGWVVVVESAATYTWTVQVKSYLAFDRAAFARAVERLRQAHLLPATITEINT